MKYITIMLAVFLLIGCQTLQVNENTSTEYELTTQCFNVDIIHGEAFPIVMEKRLSLLTKRQGIYYVYYKNKILVDIIDSKKEFQNNLTFQRQLKDRVNI